MSLSTSTTQPPSPPSSATTRLAGRAPKSSSSPSARAAAAAAMLLQHQLLMSRGVAGAGAGDSGMIPMPLSLGGSDDVVIVDRSSAFKAPNPGGDWRGFGSSSV